MSFFLNTKVQLLTLYVVISVSLVLRISVESTGYLSLDSKFYLKAAQNVLDEKGFVAPHINPFNKSSVETYFAIWPIGYPAMIAGVSYLTNLDVFWASKVLNLLFLAFIFVLLYQWFGSSALLPACYFCSFGLLEVFSYTWSEGAFLFILLWFLYLLDKVTLHKANYIHLISILFCLVAFTMIRYAGLIYFFFIALVIIMLWYKKQFAIARKLTVVSTISSVIVMIYLYQNYVHTGGFFGGEPRIFPEIETWSYFILTCLDGLSNEMFLARHFYWKWDPLFAGLICLQLLVVGFIIHSRKAISTISLASGRNGFMLFSALFYLAFILVLRKLSPFDTFDYRILAPFSAPVFILVLGSIKFDLKNARFLQVKYAIVAFFLVSLILNLPKLFLLEWVGIL